MRVLVRLSASHYRIRVRRYLRMTLPVCNYADGAGSARPPRSASNAANPTHDLCGDFTLSDFRGQGRRAIAVARAAARPHALSPVLPLLATALRFLFCLF